MSSRRILLFPRPLGRIFALLLLLSALSSHPALAQQDQKSWHLLIEPFFMHPPVYFPISGAKSTVLVPGYLGDDGDPHYLSKKDWNAQSLTWDTFRTRAAQNATEKKVAGQLIRDHNKVVQYATISSEDPLTATMVLSPDFLKRFKDIFGATILVAIPNRFTVFVFPSATADYKNYTQLILEAYHQSAYPVSLELFEISQDGIKAIGTFEDEYQPPPRTKFE
jgi:hypothetical protein